MSICNDCGDTRFEVYIYLFYLFMPQCFLWFYACFWGEITRRFILDKIYKDKMILQNLWHNNERVSVHAYMMRIHQGISAAPLHSPCGTL